MYWATNIIFLVEIYQLTIPKILLELLFPVTSLWAPGFKKKPLCIPQSSLLQTFWEWWLTWLLCILSTKLNGIFPEGSWPITTQTGSNVLMEWISGKGRENCSCYLLLIGMAAVEDTLAALQCDPSSPQPSSNSVHTKGLGSWRQWLTSWLSHLLEATPLSPITAWWVQPIPSLSFCSTNLPHSFPWCSLLHLPHLLWVLWVMLFVKETALLRNVWTMRHCYFNFQRNGFTG